jgi:hypothetical protein
MFASIAGWTAKSAASQQRGPLTLRYVAEPELVAPFSNDREIK